MRSTLILNALSAGIVLLVTGCATVPGMPPPVSSSFCSVARGPIFWSGSDSRQTKEQVDNYNRIGKKLCGWGKKK